MLPLQKDVQDFHEALDVPVGDPSDPHFSRADFRATLIAEEARELLEATTGTIWEVSNTKDPYLAAGEGEEEQRFLEAIDGMCDLIVVTLGSAVEWGVNLEPFWNEVHRTNMAKQGGPTREDGKKLKPEGWTPPDLESVMANQLQGAYDSPAVGDYNSFREGFLSCIRTTAMPDPPEEFIRGMFDKLNAGTAEEGVSPGEAMTQTAEAHTVICSGCDEDAPLASTEHDCQVNTTDGLCDCPKDECRLKRGEVSEDGLEQEAATAQAQAEAVDEQERLQNEAEVAEMEEADRAQDEPKERSEVSEQD